MSCKYDQIEKLFLSDPFHTRKSWCVDYYKDLVFILVTQLNEYDSVYSIIFKLTKSLSKVPYLHSYVLDSDLDAVAHKIKEILDAP
jgi:hypothetical protein